MSADNIRHAATFMCKVYNIAADSLDMAQFLLFAKVKGPEKLPPTSDAFRYHVMRAHYQSMVWKQTNIVVQRLPKPEDIGWKIDDDKLVPAL